MKDKINTSIDSEILQNFRDKCKQEGMPINVIIEKLMIEYINGNFTLELKYQNENGK